jgi:DNA-binding transcriptional regulator LsrR (DeoR family)
VHITFNPPPVGQMQRELTLRLADRHVRLVFVGQPTESTGYVAARFFEGRATSGMTVVLDGGRTVGDFVRELNLPKNINLSIIPIAADPPSYIISAYELMTLLSVKLPLSHCEKLPHFKGEVLAGDHERISSLARKAEFVFVGAGPCEPNHTALDFVKHLGVHPAKFKSDHGKIAYMCGYCGLDEHGNEVKFDEDFEAKMPRALTFGDLQSMAKHPDKVVALLAKGEEKVAAVSTVIKAGIVNTLFLDGPLAAALLRQEQAAA